MLSDFLSSASSIVSLVLQGPHTEVCRGHDRAFLALLTVYLVINVCKIRSFAPVFTASLKTIAWLMLLQDIPYALNMGVKNGLYH